MPCLAIFEIPIIVVVMVKQVSEAGTFIDDMNRFSNMGLHFMGLDRYIERRVFCVLCGEIEAILRDQKRSFLWSSHGRARSRSSRLVIPRFFSFKTFPFTILTNSNPLSNYSFAPETEEFTSLGCSCFRSFLLFVCRREQSVALPTISSQRRSDA